MVFLLFYITHPDEETARRIAGQVVEDRLAACANIFPVRSAYWWNGAIQHEDEWVTVLKTRLDLEAELEASIRALHPYELPCILRYEVRANTDYENWIVSATQPLP